LYIKRKIIIIIIIVNARPQSTSCTREVNVESIRGGNVM